MTRFLILALLAVPALAAPPPGTVDGPIHQWFERQHNIQGLWCCNLADGLVLDSEDWRSTGAHYEVRIDDAWITIADSQLRDPNGGPNPVGKAVVWFTANEHGLRVYCFAPGPEW